MDEGFHIDTTELSHLRDYVSDEKRKAEKLSEELRSARTLCSNGKSEISRVLEKSDALTEYFEKMVSALDFTLGEAYDLSRNIRDFLEKQTDETLSATGNINLNIYDIR